jgi:hypothetical protein
MKTKTTDYLESRADADVKYATRDCETKRVGEILQNPYFSHLFKDRQNKE